MIMIYIYIFILQYIYTGNYKACCYSPKRSSMTELHAKIKQQISKQHFQQHLGQKPPHPHSPFTSTHQLPLHRQDFGSSGVVGSSGVFDSGPPASPTVGDLKGMRFGHY